MKREFLEGIEKLERRGEFCLIRVGEFGSFWTRDTTLLLKPEAFVGSPLNIDRMKKSAALICTRLNKELTEVKVLENRGKAARVSLAVLKPSPYVETQDAASWKAERSQTFVPLSLIKEVVGKHYAPRKFVNEKLPGGRKAKPAKMVDEAAILDWLVQQNQDEMRSQAEREWRDERIAATGSRESSWIIRRRKTMDLDRDILFAEHYTNLALEYAKSHPEEAKAFALHEAPFLIAKRAAVHPGVLALANAHH